MSDKINFLYYARGSLYESKFFVERARMRGLVAEPVYCQMLDDLELLAPKLNAYIKAKRVQKKNA